MTAFIDGKLLEDVITTLQRMLGAGDLNAVSRLEVDGGDVFVDLDETGPVCRQCKHTAHEIRTALELLPRVDHAYVAFGPEGPTPGAA
ncbi:MAG TPA: hypothetical protein VI356_13940 [Myxococcales bacterium]